MTTYTNLIEILNHRAQQQPENKAYIFLKDGEKESLSITYKDLETQAKTIAASLTSIASVGDRAILIYSYNQPIEFITAFFGCLYAGIIAVPCHPPRNRQGIEEIQNRTSSSQAKIVLTETTLLSKLQSKLAATPPDSLQWLTTDNIKLQANWEAPVIRTENIAFLQYTSGSTGIPKGVMVSHGNILSNQEILKIAFGHTQKSVGVGWLPLFHDMGLIGNVIQALYLGTYCVLMSPMSFIQNPYSWLKAISTYKATTSGGPNFAYDLLCDYVKPEQKLTLDLSSWEIAFSGAEPIRSETLERFYQNFKTCGFRRESFYPCYGMAEATLFITGVKKGTPPLVKYFDEAALENNQVKVLDNPEKNSRCLVSSGEPRLDGKIIIVDPESLTPCAPNQVGEIWFSGSGVAQGYWQEPQKTQATFQAYLKDTNQGPFLRTDDLGFLQDGQLFITGRLKDIIVFWGFNHYPQLVEATIQKSHPALKVNCGAVFLALIDNQPRIVVTQEIERSYLNTLILSEIVEAIRWAVFQEHFLDIHAIDLLKTGTLPKTSSGKIQRHLCRSKFLDRTLETVASWRLPPTQSSNIKALISRYLNPLTHLTRYSLFAQGRLRRLLYLFKN